jgi:NAD(P) transhydrogenase subunit alpha
MLGNNYVNFLKMIIDKEGKLNLDFDDEIIRCTCMTHDGKIMNEKVLEILAIEEE